jgi:hypothetical protein
MAQAAQPRMHVLFLLRVADVDTPTAAQTVPAADPAAAQSAPAEQDVAPAQK